MSKTLEQIMPELEQLVDSTSLLTVIRSLEQMCYEKAEHVRSNWQDKALASQWDKAGKALDKVAASGKLDIN